MNKSFISRIVVLFIFSGVLLTVCSKAGAQDLPCYRIKAEFDEKEKKIRAKQEVDFTNPLKEPLDEIYFHIYPNKKYSKTETKFLYQFAGYFKINPFPKGFDEGSLLVNSVFLKGKRLDFHIEGEDETLLRLSLPEPLKPGESLSIELDYEVSIPNAIGRFGVNKDVYALHRWYPILSVIDGKGWRKYPCYLFHQPFFSQAAMYEVQLTVAEDIEVAHTGLRTAQWQDQGAKTLAISTENPVRDFSLALSKRFKVYELKQDNLKIYSYYLEGDSDAAKQAAEYAWQAIEYYSKNYGPYPYSVFSIAPVYLGSGGYETSNMIYLDTRVYTLSPILKRYFDFLVSHETGHQWWFNIVGSDEYTETWLDEGLNSYTTLKYLESKYGRDAKVLDLPKWLAWLVPNFSFRSSGTFRYVYLAKRGIDRPILGSLSRFKEPSSIFALAYGKGAKIFAMLEYLMGKEDFSKLLKEYYQQFKFKNACVQTFRQLAEEISGKDLSLFFNNWLYEKGFLDYAVKGVKGKTVYIENKGNINMPVVVRAEFKDGQTQEQEVLVENGRAKVIFAREVASVSLDPEEKLLELNRVDNHYPVKHKNSFVPFYFFAYEQPLFYENDRTHIITGPSAGDSGVGVTSTFLKPYDTTVSASVHASSEKVRSQVGLVQPHINNSQLSLGMSVFNEEYYDDEEGRDLNGAKIFLRQELWPAAYGLFEENDHVSLYLVRNQEYRSSQLASNDQSENLHYRQHDETITGVDLKIARRGPSPDYDTGYAFDSRIETANHFLGGKEAFWRQSQNLSLYQAVVPGGVFAARLAFGWGGPASDELFQIGGIDGLRGYANYDVRGSRFLMSNIEYRFLIKDELKVGLFDKLLTLDGVSAALFFDSGKAWFGEFEDSDFKKDAGLGIRFHVNIASFLERAVVRLDVARAIGDNDETGFRVWWSIGHTF